MSSFLRICAVPVEFVSFVAREPSTGVIGPGFAGEKSFENSRNFSSGAVFVASVGILVQARFLVVVHCD